MTEHTITVNNVGDKMPDLSTLPQRMRYAADVIAEATARHFASDDGRWTPEALHLWADQFEAEERAETDRINRVAELTQLMWQSFMLKDIAITRVEVTEIARLAVEAGWRKDDAARTPVS